jgi:glycosyltransferase involved in cell wall biosynthesis
MKCLAEAIVAQAPEHDYLLILPPNADDMVEVPAPVEKVVSGSPYYSLQEQVELPRILRRKQVDVLHSPHFNMPLARPCTTVATFHDVIYLACKQDLPSRVGRLYYHAMMAAAVRRADRIITVSEFSRGEIVRYLKADSSKIDVIHSGVDRKFRPVDDKTQVQAVLSRYRLDEAYILYTGIYKPRKNHAGLLRAFRELLLDGTRAKLVIAGATERGGDDLRRLANELGIAHKLILAGDVPDPDLPALYSAARVYACPSLYEGFGFTVLEAMACGVPVVCSPAASLPEIAGDAAHYADARNPQEFAAALQNAFSNADLRRELVTKGLNRARRFRWQSTAIATLNVYERAAGPVTEKAVCA